MPDVNDVINGLERCLVAGCDNCNQPDKSGYPWDCEGFDRMVNEAAVMLKTYVEMEKNYSQVLIETTGNLLSKTNYTVPAIMNCIQNHYCDRCGVKEERDSLLKAHESVEPIIETHWEAAPTVYDEDVKVTEYKCGACSAEIDKWDKFCRVCGRKVKWDA